MMERQGLPMLNHVLQHTLRSLCCDSQWVYAVFWRILPRNYPPPKWETDGGSVDRSKGNKRNWILVWEDGFCDFPACSSAREARPGARYGDHGCNLAGDSLETTMMHPDLFFKMSHEVYNYGEGLMGKVAADNSHKWVYREPLEHEISFLSPWHGSLDPHPRTWEAQFKAGIQTIAVISVREGLIQLGSTIKVVEDLNLVILMQRKFNYLQSIPGVFAPHPSPVAGRKRRVGGAGIDGSESPMDQHHGSLSWMNSNRDQVQINGPLMRLSSDRYRLTGYSKQLPGGLHGMNQPVDNDVMSNPGRDKPFLSLGFSYAGCPIVDSRQTNNNAHHSRDGLSVASGAFENNSGLSPHPISLLPSMSSLHNLLSKLPSVTTLPYSDPAPQSVTASVSALTQSSLSAPPLPQHQHQLPGQVMTPMASMTDSPSVSAVAALQDQSDSLSSSREQQHSALPDSTARSRSPLRQQLDLDQHQLNLNHQQQPLRDLEHQQHVSDLDHNLHQQLDLNHWQLRLDHCRQWFEQDLDHCEQQSDIDCNHDQLPLKPDHNYRQQQHHWKMTSTGMALTSLSPAKSFSKMSELFAAAASRGGGSSGPSQERDHPLVAGGPAIKDKLTSFLDSLDQDTPTDMGLQYDLENSETYHSFLSEIV